MWKLCCNAARGGDTHLHLDDLEGSRRRGLRRIKILPVVGHVHGLRETLRVRLATANVALTFMKYTHAYVI